MATKQEAQEAVREIELNWPAAGAFTGPIKDFLDAAEIPQPAAVPSTGDSVAGDSPAP